MENNDPGPPGANRDTALSRVHYKMDHRRRGLALIFNNENFFKETGLQKRNGSSTDVANLSITFVNLGFKVVIHKDLTVRQLMLQLEKASKNDHSDADCLVVVVLSHGNEQVIFAKDYGYRLSQLWDHFLPSRCSTLRGKPKLFFIQACRGESRDRGVSMAPHSSVVRSLANDNPEISHAALKTDARRMSTNTRPGPAQIDCPDFDFLVAFSTVPGYVSYRNPRTGTWFIEALCEDLYGYGHYYHILHILTFVSQKVADRQTRAPDDPHVYKQVPHVTQSLTKLLTFSETSCVGELIDHNQRSCFRRFFDRIWEFFATRISSIMETYVDNSLRGGQRNYIRVEEQPSVPNPACRPE